MATNKKKDNKSVQELEQIEEIELEEKEEVETTDNNEPFEELSLEDRVYNIEKKTNTIFVISIITLIIVLVSMILLIANNSGSSTTKKSTSGGSSTTNEQSSDENYSTAAFNKIKAQDIESVSKGKTAMIWIGRQTCGYCALYAPIVEEVQKTYGFTANYLDLYSIVDASSSTLADEEAYNILMDLKADKSCKSKVTDNNGKTVECGDVLSTRFGATPLTIFVKDNKIVGAFSGYVEASELGSILEEMGFKK